MDSLADLFVFILGDFKSFENITFKDKKSPLPNHTHAKWKWVKKEEMEFLILFTFSLWVRWGCICILSVPWRNFKCLLLLCNEHFVLPWKLDLASLFFGYSRIVANFRRVIRLEEGLIRWGRGGLIVCWENVAFS